MIKYFDSHAHLSSKQIWDDIDQVIVRSIAAGVNKIVNICTDLDTLDKGLELAKKYPEVFNVAATTPHDVEKEGDEVFAQMAEAAKSGELVAVGETGLDYYYEHSNREIQKEFLIKYLNLATECDLPVVIHCRDAFADFFEIIDANYSGSGVLHCFTGTLDEAKNVIDRGWYLSLSGIVTFKKSDELREVAKMVPIEKLLIETDTPYLAPQAFRGKRNEPSYLPETAKVIAGLRSMPLEDLAQVTYGNAERFFKL